MLYTWTTFIRSYTDVNSFYNSLERAEQDCLQIVYLKRALNASWRSNVSSQCNLQSTRRTYGLLEESAYENLTSVHMWRDTGALCPEQYLHYTVLLNNEIRLYRLTVSHQVALTNQQRGSWTKKINRWLCDKDGDISNGGYSLWK